ncbi:MAG: type II secretion system protein [Verrucomicrobiae bacterium]|nr:type II secretion system protein [Verrucomicrobiae bacterium]
MLTLERMMMKTPVMAALPKGKLIEKTAPVPAAAEALIDVKARGFCGKCNADPMKEHKHKRKAFTLVELLAVVVIFSILAALLAPALSSAREKGKQAVCMGNLRQIGLALNQYAADNDGVVVLISMRPGIGTAGWGNFLYGISTKGKYLKEWRIAHCPSGPLAKTELNPSWASYTYGCRERTTTDENSFVPDETYHPAGAIFVNLANVRNPADYPMMADSISTSQNVQVYVMGNFSTTTSGIHLRHNGCAMALFADGHVELCDPARLKAIGFVVGFAKDLGKILF